MCNCQTDETETMTNPCVDLRRETLVIRCTLAELPPPSTHFPGNKGLIKYKPIRSSTVVILMGFGSIWYCIYKKESTKN